MIDIQAFYDIVVKVCELAIVAGVSFLIPYAFRWLSSQFTAAQLSMFFKMVNAFVQGAEQVKLATGMDSRVAHDYVLNQMQAWVTQHGLKLSVKDIDSVLEAAVWKNFNEWRDGYECQDEGSEVVQAAGVSPASTSTLDVTERRPE